MSPHQLNPAVPRGLETICLKCLRKEQAGRYATAKELADDLGRWLENKPIVARRVGFAERSWLWCRRRPAIAGSIAGVLLAAAILAGLTVVERRRNRDGQVRTIVASLTSTRGVLQPPLKDLAAFPPEIVLAELRSSFETADQARRLPLAVALAHLGDVRVAFLVSQAGVASPHEVDNLVLALELFYSIG